MRTPLMCYSSATVSADLAETGRQRLLSVWRRLTPWPDAVAGLTRLKARYLIGPLSNGGFALLTEMAKAGGLPWDFVISAELFRAYKPSPEVYTGAVRLLGRSPEEVMLVAAHTGTWTGPGRPGCRRRTCPDRWSGARVQALSQTPGQMDLTSSPVTLSTWPGNWGPEQPVPARQQRSRDDPEMLASGRDNSRSASGWRRQISD